MNLADPELELIDPTPNVHNLFLHFDKVFFWAKLASRAVVRWSKRMYSCAGICSYEGSGGLCAIALSEPLLKLRPRKDLVETLLHEMIHAYLFITCRDRERDGHGPNFQSHMHRINKSAGLNISIYHEFHDEVKLYLTHWWRCNGPCQTWKPYFGVVRRSQNRAPGSKDFWWSTHQKTCGGTFVKIKEPEKKIKKGKKTENKTGDITKYITNNNNNTLNNNGGTRKPLTPLLKNGNKSTGPKTKANGGNTLVITQKNKTTTPTKLNAPPAVTAFSGSGQIINHVKNRNKSLDVNETVRNVWANKQLTGLNNNKSIIVNHNKSNEINNLDKNMKPVKQKAIPEHADSPPTKIKKIDDYFKKTASSLLKDLYGQEIKLTQENNKIIAINNNKDLVDCPICSKKVDSNEINRHLDECLNKDVIEQLSKDSIEPISQSTSIQSTDRKLPKDLVGNLPPIPAFKNKEIADTHKIFKEENGEIKLIRFNGTIDLTHINVNYTNKMQTPDIKEDNDIQFDTNDVNRVKAVVKRINYDKHIRKSDNFVVPKQEEKEIDYGFLPSFLDDMGTDIQPPIVKIEPGTSKDIVSTLTEQKCPCCGNVIKKPMAEHLDECLAFFDKNTTIPDERASTSFANNTIVIDDDEDDVFDETMTMNATGTKTPCPCCMEMVEMSDMNNHLDTCLS